LLGTLKAQDYGKAIVILCIVLGSLAAIFNWNWFVKLFHVGN
jgi:hypothetical protein